MAGHDDELAIGVAALFDLFEHLQSVKLARHPDVLQDDVGREFANLLQTLAAAVSHVHYETVVFETGGEHFANRLLIVDD